MAVFTWIGIGLCMVLAGTFSGLNLAFFSISKLRLQVEANRGNRMAARVLALRKDSNHLLATILWANVAVNVLLTLLSNSVLAGVLAFLFSTVVLTLMGEIIPQSYFSRHALKTASLLSPLVRVVRVLLYPVAKPTAVVLNAWLGAESIRYFEEEELKHVLKMHASSSENEIAEFEGIGALNFLEIDDIPVRDEGEALDPKSIISLPVHNNRPVFPAFEEADKDSFLQAVHASGKKWIVIIDGQEQPLSVLNSDSLLRAAFLDTEPLNPYHHCHRPIIINDESTRLGKVIPRLKVHPETAEDDVIDQDIILVWGSEKRIITGSDILGRLMRGIVEKGEVPFHRSSPGTPG